jgi:hypothetical protein
MPEPVTCPHCGSTTTLEDGADICTNCAATLITTQGVARRAVHRDIEALSPAQVADLRLKRATIRKNL